MIPKTEVLVSLFSLKNTESLNTSKIVIESASICDAIRPENFSSVS